MISEKLAIHGGTPVKTTKFGSGPKHTLEEWHAIRPIFERGNIHMTRGPEVMKLREAFCTLFGKRFAVTASSGTAALHTAAAALGIGRGDEVITSPFTDMGTIVAIVQQNAVPVFADVDPATLMITPETVAAAITSRTRAVIAVHLAGLACDVLGIRDLLAGRGVALIEDVAQSYLTRQRGHLVGTIGDIGCWSLNESKHIGAGDGGVLLTDDEPVAVRADLFADKCYDRSGENRAPTFAPINYRLSTLTAAVCLEQLKKVEWICGRRSELGGRLDRALSEIPGISPRPVPEGDVATYWYYVFRIDRSIVRTDLDTFCEALKAEGVYAGNMQQSFVLRWPYFQNPPDDRHACSFHCPHYDRATPVYAIDQFPGCLKALDSSVRIGFSEYYTEQDIDETAAAIRKVAEYFSRNPASS
jgi:dTDP-4-amino-4,6-dideoxygalactose transaminase